MSVEYLKNYIQLFRHTSIIIKNNINYVFVHSFSITGIDSLYEVVVNM